MMIKKKQVTRSRKYFFWFFRGKREESL